MVGFDSASAAKSRRCKNESGLQEGTCPYSTLHQSVRVLQWAAEPQALQAQCSATGGGARYSAPGYQEQVKVWMCFLSVTSEHM